MKPRRRDLQQKVALNASTRSCSRVSGSPLETGLLPATVGPLQSGAKVANLAVRVAKGTSAKKLIQVRLRWKFAQRHLVTDAGGKLRDQVRKLLHSCCFQLLDMCQQLQVLPEDTSSHCADNTVLCKKTSTIGVKPSKSEDVRRVGQYFARAVKTVRPHSNFS